MKIKHKLKEMYNHAYNNSPFFRKVMNAIGIGVGSGAIYGMSAGACPCCGTPACPVGFGILGIIALIFGAASFIFMQAKESIISIKNRITK